MARRRPFDAFFKDMAEQHPRDFIRLAFPEVRFKILSAKLDKETATVKTRVVDQVLWVSTRRGPGLLHFEYVSGYDAKIARKIFRVAALLEIKYDLEVTSVIFQLKPPPFGKDVNVYQAHLGHDPTNYFDCPVVEVWKLRDAILAGKKSLLHFVPLLLEISPTVDQKLLQRQRHLLARVKDQKRRAELTAYTMAFATKYFSPRFLFNFFKEELDMSEHWDQVPLIGDLLKARLREGQAVGQKEGRKQGLQEGLKEGLRTGIYRGALRGEKRGKKDGQVIALRETLLAVLTSRFQHDFKSNGVSGKIERRLDKIDDPRKLRALFRRALVAKSLSAFLEALPQTSASAKHKTVEA